MISNLRQLQLFFVLLAIVSGCSKNIGQITLGGADLGGMSFLVSTNNPTEGDSLTINFRLSEAPLTNMSFRYTISGSDAATDFAVTTQVFTVPAGTDSITIAVPTNDNSIYDLSRTYSLSLEKVSDPSLVEVQVFVINDNESVPVISFSSATQNVTEGDILPVTNLAISPASKFPTTVGYTVAGSASAGGVDHSMADGSFVISPLSAVASMPLSIVDDAIYEGAETIELTLTTVSSATGSAVLGAGNFREITVLDDENASLAISDVTVSESGVANFTVSVSGVAGGPVSFDWATSDGSGTSVSHYFASSGSGVTITPPATSATVTVNARDNSLVCETDKTFNVTLSNIAGAAVGDPSGVATIIDPDRPTLEFSAPSSSVAEGGTASIPVAISAACATEDITFSASTSDGLAISTTTGQDFNSLSSVTYTITAGDTSINVPVVTLNDLIHEASENLTVTIASPTESTLGTQATHTLSITDNDAAPTISIPALLTRTEGNGGGNTTVTYTVTASSVSGLNVTANYATAVNSSGAIASQPADFSATSGTVTIPAGSTTATFTINVVADTIDEFDERFSVNLSGGSNYTAAGSTLSSEVEITDDDLPPVLSIAGPVNFTEGAAGTADFTVSLSSASGKTVTFDAATTDQSAISGDDYTAVNLDNVSISPGTTSATVSVTVAEDLVHCEDDENYTLTLSDLQNASAGTLVATGNIIEDDFPTLSFASTSVSVIEGAVASFTPTLDYACPSSLSFNWRTISDTATEANDFSGVESTVTFPANTTTAGVISIPTTDDLISEVEEKFFVTTYNLDPRFIKTSSSIGLVHITDNEAGVGVAKVAVGGGFACALSNTGDVKCWGEKHNGKIGQKIDHRGDEPGEMGSSLAFLDFGDNSGTPYGVKKIARGLTHSCAILSNDRLKCWGDNLRGQLGLGHTQMMGDHASEIGNGLPFVDLGTDGSGTQYAVIDVVLSSQGTCALLANQRVKCWGTRDFGITGAGSHLGDGASEMGNSLPFMDLGGTNLVLAISSGHHHVCAILDDGVPPANSGDVKCWGRNNSGALGIGSTTQTPNAPAGFGNNLPYVDLGTGIKAISIGASNSASCALIEDDPLTLGGFIKCWGENGNGQLGINSTDDIGDGTGEMGDSLAYAIIGSGLRATSLHNGASHICAILDDDGVLNNGGNLKCWGGNSYAEVGAGFDWNDQGDVAGEMESLTFVNLGAGLKAFDVSASSGSTCVVVDNDSDHLNGRGAKCFGRTLRGQLGFPSPDPNYGDSASEMGDGLPYVDLGSVSVVALSQGPAFGNIGNSSHHCALLSDSQVKCWGEDTHHQLYQGTAILGDELADMGTNLPYVDLGTGIKALDIGVGSQIACALLDTRQVKCWGFANSAGHGALWQGIGDDPGEMGDNLPIINFGAGRSVTSLSVGESHSCAILDNFETKCWGASTSGGYQRGLGVSGYSYGPDLSSVAALDFGTGRFPLQIHSSGGVSSCAVLDNLQVKCWGHNSFAALLRDLSISMFGGTTSEDGDDLPFMDLGSGLNFLKVGASNRSSCVLTTTGQLKCWGQNDGGMLATGQTNTGSYGANLGDIAAERGASLPFVDFNGERVYDIAVHHHSCAIVGVNRELKCWGANGDGSLGRGNTSNWGDAPSEVGAGFTSIPIGAGLQAVQVSVWGWTWDFGGVTCVVLDDGSMKCWGSNARGVLGLGHDNHIGDQAGEVAALTGIDLAF